MTKIITCVGSAIIDTLFYTDEGVVVPNRSDIRRQKLMGFEFGAKIASDEVYTTFGGSAANTAMTFARLGFEPEIVTAIGDDAWGEKFTRLFRQSGIGIRLLQRVKNGMTGQSFIVSSKANEDHVSFVYRGASDSIQLASSTVEKIRTPWVYLTALAGAWKPKIDQLFKRQGRSGGRVAWNPGVHQIQQSFSTIKKYLPQTEVLLVNSDEALEIIVRGRHTIASKHPRKLLPLLHRGGQKISVLTDGGNGAYVYDGAKIYYRGSLARLVRNTNGAGDAFGSGFISGLIMYKKIQPALNLGLLNSAAVIAKIGAQSGILNRSQLKKLSRTL